MMNEKLKAKFSEIAKDLAEEMLDELLDLDYYHHLNTEEDNFVSAGELVDVLSSAFVEHIKEHDYSELVEQLRLTLEDL